MKEFDLIERIRKRVGSANARDDIVLGIGDDAAVLKPGRGMQLVATTDQLVEGRHFDRRATAADLGHLAMASNLSDLAAMGAMPRWVLLALTLPEADSEWIDGFLDGFLGLATEFETALVGGNLSSGPLNISVTALGEISAGQFARRSGAVPGDRIVVTGTLGDAAAAVKHELPRNHPLCDRLLRPSPRVACGQKLAGLARGLIDLSDGLLADLQHVLTESNHHGAEIRIDDLPTSAALVDASAEWNGGAALSELQLSGGGDYELLAIVAEHTDVPDEIAGVPLTVIGQVTDVPGIRCIDAKGEDRTPDRLGWDHFAERDASKS